ncbi:head-tail connector protein [Sphingopyxis sp. J-6]|uniref:head-tail connector protein n=1 Tax=Sphingopyxis sp. J-6 TaxID=3122054 RepID=UPI00398413AF
MIFTLDLSAMPEDYGDAVVSLEAAKAHLRVLEDDEDDLIAALRDAAVQMVENYTGLVLQPREGEAAMVWRAEGLPIGAGPVSMGCRPVREVLSVTYLDFAGAEQTVDVGTLRIVDQGSIAAAPGANWPAGVAGGVVVTFAAGLDDVPPALVTAVKMFLATLYAQRETIVLRGAAGEITAGFKMLCQPYRRLRV